MQELLTLVLLYKYGAIFVICVLGALALPIPSSAILIASAFFSTEGYLNFFFVFTIASIGNIVGDLIAYWLARVYGEKLFLKVGFRRILASKTLKLIEAKVASHPYTTVILSRFGSSITPAVSYLSGLSRMNHRTFVIGVTIGEVADTALLCVLGFFFGENWSAIQKILNEAALVVALVVLIVIAIRWKKRRDGGT